MNKFFKELQKEYNQIIWPTRNETVKKTILVIALSAFLTLLIFVFDLSFVEIGSLVLQKFSIGG